MKALLTGASSFSGLWFARALAERGVEVIAPLRSGLNSYSGLRQARVRELAKFAEIVSGVEFGSAEFFRGFGSRAVRHLLSSHCPRRGLSEPGF
jgi:UDP-glucose 4-epimerase